MKVISIPTKGFTDIVDITSLIFEIAAKDEFENGLIHLFVKGSTAGLTIIENDPNLFEDFRQMFEAIAPYKKNYRHHETWGDDNGASHLRAALLGPDLIIPIWNGRLHLGVYQRIVLVDFDTRQRKREVVITYIKSK